MKRWILILLALALGAPLAEATELIKNGRGKGKDTFLSPRPKKSRCKNPYKPCRFKKDGKKIIYKRYKIRQINQQRVTGSMW